MPNTAWAWPDSAVSPRATKSSSNTWVLTQPVLAHQSLNSRCAARFFREPARPDRPSSSTSTAPAPPASARLLHQSREIRPHFERPVKILRIRVSVEGLSTVHSLILITVHPSRLNDCVTRRSRRLLVLILLLQNSVFVRGKYLHRHPCQKQPSTKSAILRPGQAKSGLPATCQCLR